MADSDDWRVTISVSPAPAGQSSSLRQAEEDIRRQAGRIGRDVLARHGLAAESAVHRWHPIEERWETPDVPMPQTEAERQAEHQRLVDEETAESLGAGAAQWEVRVELGSHRQAVALARKLDGEGRAILRRWRYLYVGAGNEDEARELAGQIRQDAPPDAAVMVEQAGVGWPFPPS